MSAFPAKLRLGVPRDGQLIFFGDKASEQAYGDALKRWTALGATLVEFDLEPFYETARLLYEGPWVAERYLVIRDLLASSPDAIHPVTREITVAGARPYRRRHLCRAVPAAGAAPASPSAPLPISTRWCCRPRRPPTRPRRCWPIRSSSTAGSAPTPISSICSTSAASRCRRRSDPTTSRSALRCWRRPDRTRSSPRIGRVFHADTKLAMGARSLPQPPLAALPARLSGDEIAIAVVGAHLSGMALNGELKALGGRLLRSRRDRAGLQALCAEAPRRQNPACCGSRRARERRSQLELWALSGGELRKIRRRDSAAAVDRHRPSCRRPRRQGFSGRARRRRRRARHLGIRRLARVHGGEGGGVAAAIAPRLRWTTAHAMTADYTDTA